MTAAKALEMLNKANSMDEFNSILEEIENKEDKVKIEKWEFPWLLLGAYKKVESLKKQ